MQPLVLAIEPDLRQAAIVKRIVREKALADVAVVDSRDAAIEAMRSSMPDVLLLSALMSPRDEDELMAHLRTLDNADHVQTHTIPQLASALGPGEGRASRGLFAAFRRKKEPEPVSAGCDPDLFAEEIRVFIQRAADRKREPHDPARPAVEVRSEQAQSGRSRSTSEPAPAEPLAAASASAWSSPFEWKPAGERAVAPEPLRDEVPAPPVPVAVFVPPIVLPLPEPETAPPSEPLSAPVAAAEAEGGAAPLDETLAASAVEPVEPAVEPGVEPVVEPAPLVWDTPGAANPEPVWAISEAVPEAVDRPIEAAPEVSAIAVAPAELLDHEPVRERAEKIVAEVQEEAATANRATPTSPRLDEWTCDTRTPDCLGPLARWARKETPRQARPAPVTADDVRALIASLSVPPAVASVTYARGCRIRRVRVPAAPDNDMSASIGTVIVSRRVLAEQREKRPSA